MSEQSFNLFQLTTYHQYISACVSAASTSCNIHVHCAHVGCSVATGAAQTVLFLRKCCRRRPRHDNLHIFAHCGGQQICNSQLYIRVLSYCTISHTYSVHVCSLLLLSTHTARVQLAVRVAAGTAVCSTAVDVLMDILGYYNKRKMYM